MFAFPEPPGPGFGNRLRPILCPKVEEFPVAPEPTIKIMGEGPATGWPSVDELEEPAAGSGRVPGELLEVGALSGLLPVCSEALGLLRAIILPNFGRLPCCPRVWSRDVLRGIAIGFLCEYVGYE